MVVGKVAVDRGEQGEVFAGQAHHQLFNHRAGRAVAGIPTHAQRLGLQPLHQTIDVIVGDLHRTAGARTLGPIALGRQRAQLGNLLAVKGRVPHHHLEAVVVGWVVAARDHHATINAVHGRFRPVQHRRGTEADIDHVAAGRVQPLGQRGRQFGRRQAAVIADRHGAPAASPHHGGETPADRVGVVSVRACRRRSPECRIRAARWGGSCGDPSAGLLCLQQHFAGTVYPTNLLNGPAAIGMSRRHGAGPGGTDGGGGGVGGHLQPVGRPAPLFAAMGAAGDRQGGNGAGDEQRDHEPAVRGTLTPGHHPDAAAASGPRSAREAPGAPRRGKGPRQGSGRCPAASAPWGTARGTPRAPTGRG